MRLEDQVCSLELAKKLKELGVKQESYFWWDTRHINLFTKENGQPFHSEDIVSAFTVAELGNMLIYSYNLLIPVVVENDWRCPDLVNFCEMTLGKFSTMTEADARAKLVCYLVENKLVTV